jgi:hypothetical protein
MLLSCAQIFGDGTRAGFNCSTDRSDLIENLAGSIHYTPEAELVHKRIRAPDG